MTSVSTNPQRGLSAWATAGMLWLLIALVGAAAFFADGIDELLTAWQLPEYSHGPLIPLLSGLLLLRQLKEVPVDSGPKPDRWVGVTVILVSLIIATLGNMAEIGDIVAYAMIIWVGGLLLVSFGWQTGRQFWPPVLHLVFMLPLPGIVYFKLSAGLQLVSSELGVWMLRVLSVPVFLEGNIIDLGVYKLHVAEACSGLRYLFPILSFSYIFAVLYRGPLLHKAVLLISAAPITVLLNSVRIAIAGYIVNSYGLEWVEGFSHFFEGWVIFIFCILILFALARTMLFFRDRDMTLAESLDLDTSGLGTQALRVQYVQASAGFVTAALITFGASFASLAMPERGSSTIERESFLAFPREVAGWEQVGGRQTLDASVAITLGADDYHSVAFLGEGHAQPVGFFSAWYEDQRDGGVHSPEICLPGGGWEIAWLERTDMTDIVGSETPFKISRAIIQKGETRMMVYYWFEQKGRRIAWDFAAKFWLLVDNVLTGRTDGALVRLTTLIGSNETEAEAEARLQEMLLGLQEPLPRFIPLN